jgi:hypothetical protein
MKTEVMQLLENQRTCLVRLLECAAQEPAKVWADVCAVQTEPTLGGQPVRLEPRKGNLKFFRKP